MICCHYCTPRKCYCISIAHATSQNWGVTFAYSAGLRGIQQKVHVTFARLFCSEIVEGQTKKKQNSEVKLVEKENSRSVFILRIEVITGVQIMLVVCYLQETVVRSCIEFQNSSYRQYICIMPYRDILQLSFHVDSC